MSPFSPIDLAALAGFAAVWACYAAVVELTSRGRESLDARMRPFIELWIRRSAHRDPRQRVFDSRIVASLQNGAAFFAWTSLLAVGGALSLLHSIGDMLSLAADLPFAVVATRGQAEIKLIGFVVILVYAFFKFAWSYRLFNYAAIMLGGLPPASTAGEPETEAHLLRMVRLCKSAARHFSRGQRAIFFALGYLGWFIAPYALMAATLATVVVMWRRQFASDSRLAILE
jgi:uncharacterized membrane protein